MKLKEGGINRWGGKWGMRNSVDISGGSRNGWTRV